MTVAKKIEQRLQDIPNGTIFRYADLPIEPNEFEAAAKALSRLVSAGTLKRVTKGAFFKPEFYFQGFPIVTTDEEVLKQYLFKDGQRIAYITGTGLYNRIGLTTQVPFVYTIATKNRRPQFVIGKVKIRPVRSYVEVTNENYKLLGILDALKDFKNIPDLNRTSAILVLKSKLKELNPREINDTIQYALNYPPRTRALLGAILENIDNSLNLSVLQKNISPLSKYDLGITLKILPNATKWNLK
jgi:Family of unknown function (DUF6088)